VTFSPEHPGARPEFHFLLACASAGAQATPSKVKLLCEAVRDWNWLICEADRHGLIPLLARHIATFDTLPSAFAEQLRDNARQQTCHALTLTGKLFEVVDMLASNGVPVIPYKGPTVAALAYGEIGLRPCADLDILVRPEQVQRAKEILVSAGFQPASYISDLQQRLLLNCVCEYEFTSQDGSLSVEIHWRVVSPEFGFDFPDDTAWQRLQTVRMGSRSLPTLATEDLLLALAAHGTSHLWNRLIWITDIAQLMRLCAIDWDCLLSRADAFHVRRMLLLGLSLANQLLGATIPPSVATLIERDATISRLCRKVLFDSLHNPRAPGRISRHSFHLGTREQWRDKIRYVHQIGLTPQIGDFTGTEYNGGTPVENALLRMRGILRRLLNALA
jgi:hypothetical protein